MKITTTTTYEYDAESRVMKEVTVREEHEAQEGPAAVVQCIQDLVNSADWQVACPNIARQVQGAIDGREVSL